MRYSTALTIGYSAVVVVMLGVVGSAVYHQHELTVQQNHDVDAAINQIVARHNERKRLVALGLPQAPAAATYTRNEAPETTGSAVSEASAAESRPPEVKPLAVLQSTRKPGGRRTGRKHDHFLPTALATLPKLTTYTLLGLK